MKGYFDANATTPLLPEARAAWLEAVDAFWHNPSSPYRAAAAVHARLEQCRTRVASYFGCPPESVVFNSGATEGNRDVLAYWKRVAPDSRIAVSAVEHPSVLENARAFWGGETVVIPVNSEGQIRLDMLEARFSEAGDISLLSLMAANNETGVLQPWREALALARQHRAAVHIDATQWIGKLPPDGLADADFVTGSSHKFGGPKGAGFLLVSGAFSGFHGQRGGAQENDHRAGTENFPAITAMVVALELALVNGSATGRDDLAANLSSALPEIRIWGGNAPRLPNTLSLCLPTGENTQWVRRLDKRGFQVSTGSACATGKEGPSHVLAAMGATPEEARRTIRISALPDATSEDWKSLARAMIDIWDEGFSEGPMSQVIQL